MPPMRQNYTFWRSHESVKSLRRHTVQGGPALAYSYLGLEALLNGVERLSPDETAMQRDLEAHWEVIGEGIQTILRQAGYPDAYEKMKDAMMGRTLGKNDVAAIIEGLDAPEEVKSKLRALTPATYLGDAITLTELALAEISRAPNGQAQNGQAQNGRAQNGQAQNGQAKLGKA
jgi:adenylosuccinate lyase